MTENINNYTEFTGRLRVGDRVYHQWNGYGTVYSTHNLANPPWATIEFDIAVRGTGDIILENNYRGHRVEKLNGVWSVIVYKKPTRINRFSYEIKSRVINNRNELVTHWNDIKNLKHNIKIYDRKSENFLFIRQQIQTKRKLIREDVSKTVYLVRHIKENIAIENSNLIACIKEVNSKVKELRQKRKKIIEETTFFKTKGDEFTVNLQCGVNTQPEQILTLLKQRIKEICFKQKRPTTEAMHIGIEIECFIDVEEEELAQKFVEKNLGKHITIDGDGSIDPEFGEGYEIKILADLTNYESIIEKTIDVISYFEADVNSTCGLHVHLDVRKLTEKERRMIHANMVKAHDVFKKFIKHNRVYDNTYCKPNSSTLPNDNDRYLMVNYTSVEKHGTLEIRSHEGTLNADKIISWVKILLAVYQLKTPVDNIQQDINYFAKKLKISKELKDEIKYRIKTKNPHDTFISDTKKLPENEMPF